MLGSAEWVRSSHDFFSRQLSFEYRDTSSIGMTILKDIHIKVTQVGEILCLVKTNNAERQKISKRYAYSPYHY